MYPTAKHKSFGIFVKNQVEALKKRGIAVDVAAITNPQSGKKNVLMKYTSWMLRTLKAFLTKGRKYHIVHAHYVFPSGMLGLLFKKCFGTRLIVTAHGGDIDKMARKNDRLFNWTKRILQESDHVIAVGNELYDTILNEFNVPAEKISIINMGVNREIFKPINKEVARSSCGMKEETIPILFVGNMIRQKGLLELMEAMSQLIRLESSIHLYLIGPEKDHAFMEELQLFINERGIQEHISFLGTKEQTEIAKWMAAAEIFVLPSHIEGFGLVALEAMACGTPVVGTNVGGLKYLLGDQAGKIVPPMDSNAIQHAISQLLSDKKECETIIKNGEKRAEENDQEEMLDRVMDVYFPTGG